MTSYVREPIQVYLNSAEREALDRTASELGVSRSEVLRRGAAAMAGTDPTRTSALATMVDSGWVTLATARRDGPPPPSLPTAPLDEILVQLASDRGER